MKDNMAKHIKKLVVMLQSPKAGTRFKACEHLRAALIVTPEAITALHIAIFDKDETVAEAAERALRVQMV